MDQVSPLTPLPQTPDAPAAAFAGGATARRVAMLDEMAVAAQAMGLMVRAQAGRCSWVDPKDAFMFNVFERSVRQSIMLAVRLEAEAAAAALPAIAFACDALTARRTALLEAMGADALTMAKVVQAQAVTHNWIDANDAFLFKRFERAMRQSIMLADKLEADARLRAKAAAAAADAAVKAEVRAGAPAAAAQSRRQAADRLALPEEPAKPTELDRPARADTLPDKPVGVIVSRICRKLGRREDLSDFTDAELAHDREGCQTAANGKRSRKRLPMGWAEGLHGQPVKIGVELKDLFNPSPPARPGTGRKPPD